MVYSFEHPAVQRKGLDELEAADVRRQTLVSQANPEIGARLVALHQTWPDIPPGALMGMAMAGIDPMSDVAAGIEQRAVEKQAGLGFVDPGETVSAQQTERDMQRRQQNEGNPLSRGIKAGVRGALMGAESAFEEVSRRATSALVAVQDPDRTYGQAMELSTPSQAALLATDEFGWSDLGEGYIPAGGVRERQEELKQRLTMGGEWMSPGRALAVNVTEPGSKAFDFTSGLLDFGFRIFGDPATYATAGVGKARMASKAFATDSALIRGVRGVPDEQFARQWWLNSQVGQRTRQSLVDESDPYEVWQRLGGPQGKVDRDTARAIADTRTSQQLDEVVLPRLGPQGIAEKPVGTPMSRGAAMMFGDDVGAVHGLGYRVRRSRLGQARMLQWMPRDGGHINIADPDSAVLNVHRFLQGIRATADEATPIMGRAMRMGADDTAEPDHWLSLAKDLTELAADRAIRDSVGARPLTKQVEAAEGATRTVATRAGKREQKIRRDIGRAFERKHDEIVNYFQTEAASPRTTAMTWVDGTEVDLSRIPQLTTEYLSSNIPLPDMQLLRRHIGAYARVMKATDDLPRPVIQGVNDVVASAMTTAWKPMVLIRGAYIARVVGEEQMRMAAAGLDSAFRHPMSYLAYLSGRKGGVGLSGNPVDDMIEFQSIAQRKGGGWLRNAKPGDMAMRDRVRYRRHNSDGTIRDDGEFARAYADDMSMLINDAVAQRVARDGTDEAADYLMSAKGKHIRRQIAESEQWREVADSPQAMRRYLEGVAVRIEEKTRGNSDLINAISTGRLDGKDVRWAGPGGGDGPSALQRGLASRLDNVGIEEVWGRRFVTTNRRGSNAHDVLDRFNTGVDFLADMVMSKPTNHLSRFPTWRQAFVRNIEEQIGFMDEPTQRAVIKWAGSKDGANLSRTEVARMQRTAKAGQGTSITDIDTAELIAKSAATRDTRKLLYELTEVGQASDALRAAVPFAEAFKEIFVAWSRIVRDRPSVIRRGQQAVEGARGAGFFYEDPSSGEELFVYPGGKFVSRALLSGAADSKLMQGALSTPGVGALATLGLGVAGATMDEQEAEFDLVGQVTGLNLFAGSMMPGLGPAVTMPASQVMPDRPEWDWMRDNIVFPFGEPDVEGGLLEAAFPAWLDKLRTGWMKDPERDRIYANSVMDVAKSLMTTGEYSTDSPQEIDRLLNVSKQRAKGLWLIRGASQFVVPTGPQAKFRAKDLDGDWWPYQVLSSEFHRLNQEHGEDAAIQEFLATFGTDLISMVQSKSREVVPRPVDPVGDEWLRRNPDLERDYNLTVGLVAPDDPTGEFDYSAYQRQFDEGTREQLSPQQMLWLSNNTLGRFAYANGVEQIEAFTTNELEARQARAALRGTLMGRFPGFGSHVGVSQRPDVEEQVGELEQMAQDPRLQGNPAVDGVREYLAVRRQAATMVTMMASRSTTFTRSNETKPIRRWMRAKADQIAQEHPEFLTVFERVFERELAEDDEPAEPGQMIEGASNVALVGNGG